LDRYVYYRAPVAQAAEVQRRVLAMQQQVTQQTGVRCEVKRRPVAEGALHTWMEVYHGITAGFDEALRQAEQQHALATLIVGARHTDDFLNPVEWE
jgi:Domain of unknown function (DUF4936)